MCTAIIVAAGKGLRMQCSRPKQFLPLGGKSILAMTLAAFDACPEIRRIILVVPEKEFAFCRCQVLPGRENACPVDLVPGGEHRQDSVYNGLIAMAGAALDHVTLIHDGVRPFVPATLIENCIEGARKFGACTAAIPMHDTVKRIDTEGAVAETIDRERLRLAQTPQAFGYGLIRSAHEKAKGDGWLGTDDASLVERLGKPVRIVAGSPRNIKITSPHDLAVAKALAASDFAE